MILRSIGLTASGNFLYAVCQWVTVIIIARLGNLESQGHYSYFLAILAPITMLSRLNLRAVLATDHTDVFGFEDYLSARVVLSLIALVSVPLYVTFVGEDSVAIAIALGVSLMKFVEGIAEITHGQLQRTNQYGVIFSGLAIRSIVMVVTFQMVMLFEGDVGVAAICTAIAWMFVWRGCEWRRIDTRLASIGKSSVERVRRLVAKCWALGISMALLSVFSYMPVYFLKVYATISDVGRFSAISYLWMIGVFMATAIIQAISPRMAAVFHQNGLRYCRTFLRINVVLIFAGLLVVAASSLWGEQLVILLYGEQYAGLGEVFALMAIGIVFSSIIALIGMSLTIARAFNGMLIANIISVITISVLCMMFVPQEGILGAAKALVIALAAKLVFSLIQNQMVFRRHARSGD